jgi:hypothetical protein
MRYLKVSATGHEPVDSLRMPQFKILDLVILNQITQALYNLYPSERD